MERSATVHGPAVSGRIVREVLDHAPEDLTKLDLLVLISLAESAHDNDRTARSEASADAIAYRVRSTPSSVRNALQRLKERALIRPVHQKVHRGHAQDWTITKLSDHHREARKASPGSDAIDHRKRHPQVTLRAVEN